MPTRRVNPYLVKLNRSYSASELASCLGAHKNTVRNWQREGLTPIDRSRPRLFHGQAVRAFLITRQANRKRPCPPGTFFCFRCREPRRPALGMVEFVEPMAGTGNLRALCENCETIMHRRVRRSAIATAMPGIDVQIRQAPLRFSGSSDPSLICVAE